VNWLRSEALKAVSGVLKSVSSQIETTVNCKRWYYSPGMAG